MIRSTISLSIGQQCFPRSQGDSGFRFATTSDELLPLLEVANLLKHDWLFCFFNEFLKLRVATQRIPKRHQFQLAIAEVARATKGNSKLFESEIFVTEPRSDHRQILDHHVATELIFFYWKKLDRAPSFAQCFLSGRARRRSNQARTGPAHNLAELG